MYLSRFAVKNYKCLGDIDIPLTPIHVLIGPNDSGKTSLMEAMAAFCASSEKPLREIFPEPWSGRDLVQQRDASSCVRFHADWQGDNPADNGGNTNGYSLSVCFPMEGKSCFLKEEVAWADGQGQSATSQASGAFTLLRMVKLHGSSKESARQSVLARVSQWLKPAHMYSFEPRLMAVPAAIDPQRRFRMDPDGFGLPTLLDDILGYDAELFLRLRSEFCQFFPQFRSVRIESQEASARTYDAGGRHKAGHGHGKGIYFELQSGATVRAQQASDGAILFLGFLAIAHLPEPPNLVLIEEPENGVYPKRLAEMISLLRQMVGRTDGVKFPQIVLSTHSPFVLSFFQPNEVTFLSRPPGEPDAPVRARPLRDAPHIKERLAGGEFYLGELWYNLSEEELFGGQ